MDPSGMTVRELKAELKRRNALRTGRKAELVQRLRDLIEQEKSRGATRQNRNDIQNAIFQISISEQICDLPCVIRKLIAEYAKPAIPYSNVLPILRELHEIAISVLDASEDSDHEFFEREDTEIRRAFFLTKPRFKIPACVKPLKKYVLTVTDEQDEYLTLEEKEETINDDKRGRKRKRRKTRTIKHELGRKTEFECRLVLGITNSRVEAEMLSYEYASDFEDMLRREGPFYLTIYYTTDKQIQPSVNQLKKKSISPLKVLPTFSHNPMATNFCRIAKFESLGDLVGDMTLIKKVHKFLEEAHADIGRCSKNTCFSVTTKSMTTSSSDASEGKRTWSYEVFCGNQTGGGSPSTRCLQCNISRLFE
eukprot:g155.t1